MDICITSDDKYLPHAGVLICSVCENNRECHINTHIIVSSDVSLKQKCKIESLQSRYDLTVYWYGFSKSIEELFPIRQPFQSPLSSLAAYYRLFMPEILPDTVKKVLYLDVDMFNRSSLKELWETPLDNVPLAACENVFFTGENPFQRLSLDKAYGYFNSGVLLINLDYWRANGCISKCLGYAEANRNRLSYHDQDILNGCFYQQAIRIPAKYNAQDLFFHRTKFPSAVPDEERDECVTHPVLVHFSSDMKPWIRGSRHPYQREYLRYKRMSPWRWSPLALKRPYTIKEKIINVLVFLGLHRYNGDYIDL